MSKSIKSIIAYDAVLFDLDGVLTPTIILHKQAWKRLFEQALPKDVAPYTDDDYLKYVDGKPRYDGVASLMKSRGLEIPWGDPTDDTSRDTICGLGNRKNDEFEELLHREGIQPYVDVVDVLRHLKTAGLYLAVVSSSRNAVEVLETAGIIDYFDAIVDGNVRSEQGLKGKPAPDTYVYGANVLGVDPTNAVVVEDALSGVAAGRSGGFGLVVGVDRGAGCEALLSNGADVVVTELRQMVTGSYGKSHGRSFDPNRDGDPLEASAYPINEWTFTEIGRPTAQSATIFSLSNGNIGIRGAGDANRRLGSGTFLSGYHETYRIKHAEDAYGFARIGQVIQGVPDIMDYTFMVDGKQLPEPEGQWQKLDYADGYLTEHREYHLPAGTLVVQARRMVCLFDANLATCSFTLEWDGSQPVRVVADGTPETRVMERVQSDDPRKSETSDGGIHQVESDGPYQAYRCENSGMTMAFGFEQVMDGEAVPPVADFVLERGRSVTISRRATYHSYPTPAEGIRKGLRVPSADLQDPAKLIDGCRKTLDGVRDRSDQYLCDRQRAWLADFWNRADIRVETDDESAKRVQQVIRWELFQLAQTTAFMPNGIPAKGLSGSGYSGHYFWDMETFTVPFLTYTNPENARKALEFRYRMLPAAKKRAAAMNVDGALYPWRTINGEEGSAFFLAGTAQYHIDADIAYAIAQYAGVTGDSRFIAEKGVDILVQTARMWADLGHYAPDGSFHINGVTGPDEYTALVDDNFYTNAMSRENLLNAVGALESMDDADRQEAEARLHIRPGEVEQWKRAAAHMTLLKDGDTGLHLQDARFVDRPDWDEGKTMHPLLLHYHMLDIYRAKVLKQTDMVLTLFLLSDQFTKEEKKRDFDYYDPYTTGDSTLSAGTQAIVASDIGYEDKALNLFLQSLYTDVADLHANTTDGIHLASAGGIWMTLVNGFGGLRDSGGKDITINPHLPESWQKLVYHIRIKSSLFEVTVTHDGVDLQRLEGEPVELTIQGKRQFK